MSRGRQRAYGTRRQRVGVARGEFPQLAKEVGKGQTMVVAVGDITEFGGCIVNAANETLLGGGGVDGAIHRAAGPGLLEECRGLGGCGTGEAKATKGYKLKAEWVIHTVGPVCEGARALFKRRHGVHENPEELLSACYRNSLDVAAGLGVREISFPAISTGVFAYPKDEAALVATRTVRDWLAGHPGYELLVRFVCWERADYEAYAALLG